MKQYLKFSLLIVLLTLFGSMFAQKHIPSTYDEDQQVFRNEMNRLDSFCNASNPIKNVKASDNWYEPAVITMFDIKGNPTHRHSWTYIDANCIDLRNILTEVWEDFDINAKKYVNTRRRTFTYDTNGNWINGLIEVWNGKSWINYWRFECKYDDKNRMIFQTQDQIYKDNWTGSVRWVNQWNDSDSIIDRMYERATIDGIWVKTLHQIWKYDASGNLLQEGMQHLKPKEDNSDYYWTGYTGWTYVYDEAGYKIWGLATNEGDSTGREVYTNDAQGNRLSRTNELYLNDEWVNKFRNEWTYDENKRMKTQAYDRFEEKWIPSAFQTWDYDENGNTIKWTDDFFDSIGGAKIGRYQMFYTYDADNHLLKLDQELYYPDSNQWRDNYNEDYTYDLNGNKLTEVWNSVWGSNGYLKILDLAWTYDENGNSIMVKAAALPERIAYFIYYNNTLAQYGLPYFLTFAVSASYVDIRGGVAVTGITLNETNLTLKVKETFQLEAVINPTDASNKEIRWSSSDDKTVSVSSDGLVKVLKSGTATITVTAVDGGLTDHCMVVSPVSIDDINSANISIFTSNNSIVINSDVRIQDVSVRDIMGRLIYKANDADPIATSSWSRGIYIVKVVNSNNVIKINKIIVK